MTVAVSDFNVTIPGGKLIGLLGLLGCGKSTTLYMIAGLHKPSRGKIFFGDEDEYSVKKLDGSKEIDLEKEEGFVVSIEKLKVKKVQSPNEEGAYTIYCETLSGQEINVRVDGGANPKLVNSSIEVGKLYNVIGGVSKFNETYQIMMANQKGEAVNDFVLRE